MVAFALESVFFEIVDFSNASDAGGIVVCAYFFLGMKRAAPEMLLMKIEIKKTLITQRLSEASIRCF
jgi:hypothetical protein